MGSELIVGLRYLSRVLSARAACVWNWILTIDTTTLVLRSTAISLLLILLYTIHVFDSEQKLKIDACGLENGVRFAMVALCVPQSAFFMCARGRAAGPCDLARARCPRRVTRDICWR